MLKMLVFSLVMVGLVYSFPAFSAPLITLQVAGVLFILHEGMKDGN